MFSAFLWPGDSTRPQGGPFINENKLTTKILFLAKTLQAHWRNAQQDKLSLWLPINHVTPK
jgi:hypothetical protein